MQATARFALVLVTAPDMKIARRLARLALEKRVAACANLVPKIESHYWWQGKIESGAEVLIVFKTTRRTLKALEGVVLSEHPYDTPEFVVVNIAGGNARYLAWITESVASR